MGVYIKGLKLPSEQRQGELLILTSDGRCVDIFRGEYQAVEVPTPHGRLIDADALKEQWLNAERTTGAEKVLNLPLECFISYGCVYDLDNAPTIIEAEDGE